MKILRASVTTIALMILPFVAAAQEGIPRKATVQGGSSGPLRAGEKYTFQVVLDPPPQRYEEGWIEAQFECEPSPADDVFGSPLGDEWCKRTASVRPRNGVASYSLTLPISETMIPGKWKLVQMTISQATLTVLPFTGVAAFEIPRLHPVKLIDVQPPKTVEAGQRFTVKVTVDGYPKDAYKDCGLFLGVQLNPGTPEQSVTQQITPNQNSYEFSFRYFPDTPAGPVAGEVTYSGGVFEGGGGDRMAGCRYPKLEGNRKFEFAITAAKGVVTPKSATVLNSDQIRLFKTQAGQLRDEAHQLNPKNVSNILREAMRDLDAAEKKYLALGVQPSPEEAAKIEAFFNDIRLNYPKTLKARAENSGQGQPIIIFIRASTVGLNLYPVSSSPLEEVRASVEHNADAYDAAVSSGTVEFTLYVYSDPHGAAISYRLRGDNYTPVSQPTDWHIDSLPLGVYCIRLQMPDYKDNEVPFDATTAKNMSVHVTLEHEGVQRCQQ